MSGFVSESLVLGGFYMLANGNPTLGGVSLVIGVMCGFLSFLYRISLDYTIEKRRAEIFEISKGLLTKALKAVNEVVQKSERTVH